MTLVAAESFSWPLAADETLETTLELTGPLTAPVAAGTAAGEAVFTVNGQEVGRVTLICGTDVPPGVESAMSLLRRGLPQ